MAVPYTFTKEIDYTKRSKWTGTVYLGTGMSGQRLFRNGYDVASHYYYDADPTQFFALSRRALERKMDRAIKKYVNFQTTKIHDRIEIEI